MTTVTWGGNSGSWGDPLLWQNFQVPGAADTAVFQAGDASTITIDAPQAIAAIDLGTGTGATLLVENTLGLAGSLALDAGTLDLAATGTIEGGTVDLAGGTVIASGGVADGVVWLGALGNGLAITAQTAAATQAVTGTALAVAGSLTLEGGTYESGFLAQTYALPSDTLVAAAGQTVVFGTGSIISASADDPEAAAGVMPTVSGLTLGGAGDFINNGTLVSDLSFAPLQFTASGFANAGTIALNPSIVDDVQQVFLVTQGHIETPVTLTFDQTLAPVLAISDMSFSNLGLITGAAATVTVTGSTFLNAGTISLTSVLAQTPVQTADSAYLATVTLDSTIDIAASVTGFDNTGLIAAGTIDLACNLTLAQLGIVHGDVVFTGTLDLGGGTLDVGKVDPDGSVTFLGAVLNGTLVVDGGTLSTAGATLVGVIVLNQAPQVALNVTSGSVVLDAVTTELAYTTAATIDGLSVTAGAVGVPDQIGARAAGTLTFGADTTISDTLAGTTLEIGGQGTFAENGGIVLDGATLDIATLDGTGTISLSGGASATLDTIAPGSGVTIVFGSDNDLLTLPANASGVNTLGLILTGLTSGDLIDFAAVGSNPPIGAPFGEGGAGVLNGTLEVQGASGDQAAVVLGGSAGAGLTFAVSSDDSGGTIVTVSCFRQGTRIATPRGQRAVERLRIGDLVLTGSGRAVPIKWLGRRSYGAALVAAQRQLRPVRFASGSLGPGLPRRPLFLSPQHAVLLRGSGGSDVLVPAAALVDGRRITRAPIEAVSYVHIELDTPDTVIAEGALAETFVDCDSRRLFDNAAGYAALYGEHQASSPAFFAPRIEEGWELERIRAALPGATPHTTGGDAAGGHMRGGIDRAADGIIEGWAMDEASPDRPVQLDLVLDSHRLGRIVANRYRIDLDRAGLASDACAFRVTAPALDPAVLAAIRLRNLRTGAFLGG